MTAKKLSQITLKLLGRSLVLVVDGKSMVFTSPDKEKRDKIRAMVENYNKLPTDVKKEKIVKAVTPKKQAAEEKAKVEKKLKHKQAKVAKVEIKKVKKEKKNLLITAAGVSAEVREYLKGDSRFVLKDGDVYLDPYLEVPMPKDLVTEILNWMDKGDSLQPLINFWMLALLNPNPIARTRMFAYLKRHKLIITPNGYIVTFRMVKKTNKPDVYTSARTGKEEYRIGEAYRMPRTECDEDGNNSCSRGLHTGSPEFIGIHGLGDGYKMGTRIMTKEEGGGQGTGYGETTRSPQHFNQDFGNQAVVVLVNPMHVVSIPNDDTRKMRSCELYFVKTTTPEEVTKMQLSDYALYDQQYKEFEAAELEKMLKETKLEYYVDAAVDATGARKAELEAKIRELEQKMKLGGDNMSQTGLSMDQIRKIIKSRVS